MKDERNAKLEKLARMGVGPQQQPPSTPSAAAVSMLSPTSSGGTMRLPPRPPGPPPPPSSGSGGGSSSRPVVPSRPDQHKLPRLLGDEMLESKQHKRELTRG